MNVKTIFPLVLLLALAWPTAWAANELPTLIMQARVVEQDMGVDAVVEAVRQSTVGTQVPGRILEVKVDAGQTVKQGDLLMRIDAREAGEALRAAESQFANAAAQFKRTQRLVEQKFMSASALDRAQADLDAAAAARKSALAGQSHASIVAPMSGIVASRHAEAGDMAMPGTPLVTLFQPGSLRVTASIPQAKLAALRNAGQVRVEFPELNKRVEAAAIQILPTVDAATHTASVRINLPAMPDILPGMAARVRLLTGRSEALMVPLKAIVRRGELAAVYVRQPDGRLLMRQLRLGERLPNDEYPVLAGLAAGDVVVADAAAALRQLKAGQ